MISSSNVLRSTYTVNINLNETNSNLRNTLEKPIRQDKYITATFLPYLESNTSHVNKKSIISKIVDKRVINDTIESSSSTCNSSSSSISLSSSTSVNNLKLPQNRLLYTKLPIIEEKSGFKSSYDSNFDHLTSKIRGFQSNCAIYSIEHPNRSYFLPNERSPKQFLSVSNINLLSNKVPESGYNSNETSIYDLKIYNNFRNQIHFKPCIYLDNFGEGKF
jgi:hypothetical protein